MNALLASQIHRSSQQRCRKWSRVTIVGLAAKNNLERREKDRERAPTATNHFLALTARVVASRITFKIRRRHPWHATIHAAMTSSRNENPLCYSSIALRPYENDLRIYSWQWKLMIYAHSFSCVDVARKLYQQSRKRFIVSLTEGGAKQRNATLKNCMALYTYKWYIEINRFVEMIKSSITEFNVDKTAAFYHIVKWNWNCTFMACASYLNLFSLINFSIR